MFVKCHIDSMKSNPDHYITERQCQEMIDKAIDKHNKTATVNTYRNSSSVLRSRSFDCVGGLEIGKGGRVV